MGRRIALVMIGALAATLPIIIVPSASAAPQGDLLCAGSLSASFSPGVTLASANQTVTAVLKGGTDFQPGVGCTSVNGIAYQGVSATVNLTGMVSCFVGNLTGSGSLTWDNGDVSAVNARVTTIGPIPLVDARITSGALTGARVVLVGIPTGITGSCGKPVTRLSFIGAARFQV